MDQLQPATIAIIVVVFSIQRFDSSKPELNITRLRIPAAPHSRIAAGTSSGRTLRLKGRGFTRKDGSRGDQLVTLEISLPEADDDLAKRLEGWRDARDLRGRFGV